MKRKQQGIQAAEKTIQAKLSKEFGAEGKTILDKIDRMEAQKKPRKQIEAMIAAEIARCTKKSVRDLCVFIT